MNCWMMRIYFLKDYDYPLRFRHASINSFNELMNEINIKNT